jgi:uncharacterized protein YdhG (YjbR/CyaY superfamily)
MDLFEKYLSELPDTQRLELERIVRIVRNIVPNAEETYSYGIPTFKYKGKHLLGLAAFKNHMSLFPTSGPVGVIKEELAEYKISRGTIQFTSENTLPEKLVSKIIMVRMEDIEDKLRI